MRKNDLCVVLIITILISFICGAAIEYIILFDKSDGSLIVNDNTSITLNEDDSINDGISRVYDAVFVIEGFKNNQMISTGTGFAYKKDDKNVYLMTNHHVINNCDKVVVISSSKDEIDATILGSEAYSDIAVLKISSDNLKQLAKIGDSNKLKIGDTLFAIGSPEGVDYAGTVTKGILSGKDRIVEVALNDSQVSDYYMKVLQTDVAINPGNSGGPLCNIDGEIVGITNMKLVDSTVEGMGFAIPIEDAINYAKILEKGDKIKRPFVGISMADVNNSYYLWQNRITIPNNVTSGVVVMEVVDDSPASRAKLQKGDIIIKMGDKDISSIAEFRYELYKHNVNDEIVITFIRNNKKQSVKLTLVDTPS